ncbi:mechanosensitive ion channel domain-containing protein [Fusobacterium sp. SYSU M8D902]|uniref:mechanosensitive ion channel family protein n=1 Tax=Fusobacterium sp. SYSU M8D902 TaxID=3159562 RepID=UPI0032E490B2
MDLLEIITSVEGENGKHILKIILNDSVMFILRLILFLIVIYIGKKIIEFLLNKLDAVPQTKLNTGARDFTKSFVKLSLYVVLFLLGLLIFGFNEHSIFTMISAIGLGIGISLKDFLSNLAGGVIILFTKPFNVGEYIEVSGAFGKVCKIEVFSTHIDTLDSKRVIIPNNLMVNSLVVNYDTNEYRKIKLDISVSYECDHLKAIELLENISKTFPGLEHDRKTFINFMEYGASSVNILFIAWSKRDNYYRTRSLLIAHIIKVFNEANIEIPYDKLDVNIKEEPEKEEKN